MSFLFKVRRVQFTASPSYNLVEPVASVAIAASALWREISKKFDPNKDPDSPIDAAADLRYQTATALCVLHEAETGVPVLLRLIEAYNAPVPAAAQPVNDTPDSTDQPVTLVPSGRKLLPSFQPGASLVEIFDHLDLDESLRMTEYAMSCIPQSMITAAFDQAESEGILTIAAKKKPQT